MAREATPELGPDGDLDHELQVARYLVSASHKRPTCWTTVSGRPTTRPGHREARLGRNAEGPL